MCQAVRQGRPYQVWARTWNDRHAYNTAYARGTGDGLMRNAAEAAHGSPGDGAAGAADRPVDMEEDADGVPWPSPEDMAEDEDEDEDEDDRGDAGAPWDGAWTAAGVPCTPQYARGSVCPVLFMLCYRILWVDVRSGVRGVGVVGVNWIFRCIP